MAENIKVSQLPVASSVDDADIVPIVQGGVTKQATAAQMQRGTTFGKSLTAAADNVAAQETIGIPAICPRLGGRPWRMIQRINEVDGASVVQLRALVFGDSIARFKPQYYLSWAAGALGTPIPLDTSGTGAMLPLNAVGAWCDTSTAAGSPTYPTDQYAYWPTGAITVMPNGSAVDFIEGGGSPHGQKITLYYVKESGAGTVTLSVGGSVVATLDASDTSINLGVYEYTKSSIQDAVRVSCTSGTVRVIGVMRRRTDISGLVVATVDRGGLALNDAMSQSSGRSLFQSFLANFTPDVVTFEMREASSYLAAAFGSLAAIINTAAPTADVIVTGSSPLANSTDDADQLAQNSILKTSSAANNFIYWDGYDPCQSWAHLNALGWSSNDPTGTHIDKACSRYLAMLMVADFGLSPFLSYSAAAPACAGRAAILGSGTTIGSGDGVTPSMRLAEESIYRLDAMIEGTRSFTWRLCYPDTTMNDCMKLSRDGGGVRLEIMPVHQIYDDGRFAQIRNYPDGYDRISWITTSDSQPMPIAVSRVDLRSYTVATLPSLVTSCGSIAYCSDASGGGVPVYTRPGDVVWRRFDTNAQVTT